MINIDAIMKCPKCGETERIATERRPDGDSFCGVCGLKAKTSFFLPPPEKDFVEILNEFIARLVRFAALRPDECGIEGQSGIIEIKVNERLFNLIKKEMPTKHFDGNPLVVTTCAGNLKIIKERTVITLFRHLYKNEEQKLVFTDWSEMSSSPVGDKSIYTEKKELEVYL